MDEDSLAQLQERLGVQFKDVSWLRRALTHRSAASEDHVESNERLEFLGDSVVGLVVSECLFRRFPDRAEGELAKSKAYIVSEPALAEAAIALELDRFVLMSPGEQSSGGRRRRSILADVFEAVVAAIYLDRGIIAARRLVRTSLQPAMLAVELDGHHRDYKSALQVRTQAQARRAPNYRITEETGEEHDKTFHAEAVLVEAVIGSGAGKTKKEAEQAAARDALERTSIAEPEGAAPANGAK